MFQEFLSNLRIDTNKEPQISMRYEEITACLNKTFRDTESKTANSLQVGSYGRGTAVKGTSDLDMLYIMPNREWVNYNKSNGQYELLRDVSNTIQTRYPKTKIHVDRLVVCVSYADFYIEVQPVFEQDDGSFKYPDTYNGGSWKITKPRGEIKAMQEFNTEKNNNLRRLCKMVRAWKNEHGVNMGGLLIDTLCHNFLKSTNKYDDKSYLYYDWLSRDFFKYLSEQPNQDYYAALGSGQRVRVKSKFQKKAKEGYELCLKAIESEESDSVHDKWKQVYGRAFPAKPKTINESSTAKSANTWVDTEEFIDDKYKVDIRYNLTLECDVSQNGFREYHLTDMLAKKIPLLANKKLLFTISNINVPEPFTIKWKVLNRGIEAQRRNCIRGQIIDDAGYKERKETTNFRGEHLVECYAIKDNVVVARGSIDVPIR